MASELKMGIGRSDLAPAPNMPGGIWKTQKHIRAGGIHLPLYTTCFLFEGGGETVAIINFDLCFFTPTQEQAVVREVAQAISLEDDRVWVFCTHTHAPPLTSAAYHGEGVDEVRAFVETLPRHAATAAREALTSTRPVRIATGHGESHIGVNRDLVTDEGRTVVAPNPEGFMDPDVGVMRIDEVDGRPYGCLMTYGCHPHVLGPDNTLISPDYPGTSRDLIESFTGATCLFLQAAGGNVCPIETFVADPSVSERLGTMLGCEAIKVFLELRTDSSKEVLDYVIESAAPLGIMKRIPEPEPETVFRLISRNVELPLRRGLSNQYEALKSELAGIEKKLQDLEKQRNTEARPRDSDSLNETFNTATIEAMRVRTELGYFSHVLEAGHYALKMRVLRVNSIALIASEGEVFSELGSRVKKDSPFADTLFAAYMGNTGPYLGPKEYYGERPGYEISSSPFSPDAADEYLQEANDLLRSIHS